MKESASSTFIDYLLIFILIYTSRETILFGTNLDGIMLTIGFVSPLFVLFLLLFRKHQFDDYSRTSFNLLISLCVFSFVTMLCNFDINIKYGYEVLLFLLSYHIANQFEFKKFTKVYCNINQFLAIFAIITTFIYYLAPSFLNIFPIVVNKSNLQYYNLFFSVVPVDRPGVVYRLYGIFREPGVAIIFFDVALIFELFFSERNKIFRVLVLLLAIGFSYSTAGYIVTFIVFVVYLLNNHKSHHGITFILAIMMAIVVVLISQNNYLNMMVFGKLSDSDNTSRAARFGSVMNNINLILVNPLGIIWGLGYQYVEDAFVMIGNMYSGGQGHNTNTILKELSVHGVLFTVYLLVNLLYFIRRRFPLNRILSFALFIVFIIAFGNEDLTTDILLFLLIFYSRKKEKTWKKNVQITN